MSWHELWLTQHPQTAMLLNEIEMFIRDLAQERDYFVALAQQEHQLRSSCAKDCECIEQAYIEWVTVTDGVA